MFISVHIPKTAGTTLAAIFDYGTGRRILYDYKQIETLSINSAEADPYFENDKYKSDVLAIKEHQDFILDNFDFIHGHFYQKKYTQVFPEAKLITCVRKPIKRLVSHYYHVFDEAIHDYWLYQEISSGNIDLVEMARIPGIGNMQSVYLNGRDVMDYDHVFVNEMLADSIYQFQVIHDFKRNDPWMNRNGKDSVPNLNYMSERGERKITLSQSMINAAEALLEEDNELYEKALKKYKNQYVLANSLICKG